MKESARKARAQGARRQKIPDKFHQLAKVSQVFGEGKVKQALNDIIKEVGNKTNVDNNPSKKVSAPKVLIAHTETAITPVNNRSLSIVDQRKFSSKEYELRNTWLYFSHTNNGFMCNILSEVLIQFHKLPGDACRTRKVRPKRQKQNTNIDYTKLAAEIIRLQSGNINIPPSTDSTIIQADKHAVTGTNRTHIIPTSPLPQNINPAVNTVPTLIPSLAASEVRPRASQIQENPPCTVAPEDSADSPSCSTSTSKEFNIQTVVETLFFR
ncbi:unnamed protein product [Mytilus coruscus]|uniref:Uncharacterized protein n=1 Tax=Mytilus coruscus TaxID=42192 RepID=A0A6J8ARE9_MYTCO|nr:unnamed protein product [Mytilus coruscus]